MTKRMSSIVSMTLALAAMLLVTGSAQAGSLLGNWTDDQVESGWSGGGASVLDSSGISLDGYTGNGNLVTAWTGYQNGGRIGGDVSMDKADQPDYQDDLRPFFNVNDASYNNELSGMASLTLSAWIYMPTGYTDTTYDRYACTKMGAYTLGVNTSGKFFATIIGNAGSTTVSADINGSGFTATERDDGGWCGWNALQWSLLTATYNGATGLTSLYLNGNLLNSGTGDALGVVASTTNKLHAGSGKILSTTDPEDSITSNVKYSGAWVGGLDDLSIFNTALSQAKIKAMANAANSLASGENTYYDATDMSGLFDVFDTGTAATISTGTTWHKTGNLAHFGHSAGDVWTDNGHTYIELDSAGTGVGTSVILSGDANMDGKVDINDLTIVLAQYNQTGKIWAQGDFNGDNKVDINDLTIVLTNYNTSAGVGINAVPEPCTLAILLAGAVGLLAYAWRRREF